MNNSPSAKERLRTLEEFYLAVRNNPCVETVSWGLAGNKTVLVVFVTDNHVASSALPRRYGNYEVILKVATPGVLHGTA